MTRKIGIAFPLSLNNTCYSGVTVNDIGDIVHINNSVRLLSHPQGVNSIGDDHAFVFWTVYRCVVCWFMVCSPQATMGCCSLLLGSGLKVALFSAFSHF